MPLPLPVKIVMAIYKYAAPLFGDDSKIKKWIVKNKLLATLISFLIVQLFIIVMHVDQLLESNKQIVERDKIIKELRVEITHIEDKNKVLSTVLERAVKAPLDGLKSTEAIPLPEPEIRTPVESPYEPKKPDPNELSSGRELYTRRLDDPMSEGI